MSLIQGMQSFGEIAADRVTLDKRSDFILGVAKLAPFNAFLEFVPKGKRPTAELVQWYEDDFFPYQITVTVAANDSATTLTVAAQQKRVVAGDLLQNPVTRETILVSALNSTTQIDVIRNIGATSGVIAENQVLLVIGNVSGEGTGRPTAKVQEGAWDDNYIQQVKKSWDLTGRVERLGTEDMKGKGAVYRENKARRIQEFLRELELTCWFGQSGTDSTAADGKRRTFMGGVEQFIRAATDRTYNINGNLTLWSQIEAMSEQAFDKTDGDTLYWFASRRILSQINQFFFGKVVPDDYTTKKLGVKVQSLETTDGEIKLIREHWFKGDLAGYGFLLDKQCVRKAETIPVKIHDDTQDKETDARCGFVEWEGTLEVRHAERMLLAYGCTTM